MDSDISVLVFCVYGVVYAGDSINQAQSKKPQSRERVVLSPFAKWFFAWGKIFRKHLPEEWKIEVENSQLRDIYWQADAREGYRMRFVHESIKVPIPVPFPDFQPGVDNTEVVPLRCSLHFYPRKGSYFAYDSKITRVKPAKLKAVLAQAIVLQADRFMASEFPCPAVIAIFHRITKTSAKGQSFKFQKSKLAQDKDALTARVYRHNHHIEMYIKGKKREIAWEVYAREAGVRTVVLHFTEDYNNWIAVHNITN
jgi:hypothetical protein